MVIIAVFALVALLIVVLFAVAVVVAIICLIRGMFRALRPRRMPTEASPTVEAAEPWAITELENDEFNSIVAREWPSS